ncbi:hypothetical protein ABZ883_42390 [Streptomyces sp. NPDC046977]|uniref:hypothetical protein n=1 Tax=Streptomyces sp. NPDC046977 TaxID=3154703 RepID=UPI0033F69A54
MASWELHHGDAPTILPTLTGQVDAVICDPPYNSGGWTTTEHTTRTAPARVNRVRAAVGIVRLALQQIEDARRPARSTKPPKPSPTPASASTTAPAPCTPKANATTATLPPAAEPAAPQTTKRRAPMLGQPRDAPLLNSPEGETGGSIVPATALLRHPRTLLIAATVPLALAAAVVDDVRVHRQRDAARRDLLTGLPGRDGLAPPRHLA